MKAGVSTRTHTQVLLAHAGTIGSVTTRRASEPAAQSRPEYRTALTRVEPEDLARFEGEGGLGEPEPAEPRRR